MNQAYSGAARVHRPQVLTRVRGYGLKDLGPTVVADAGVGDYIERRRLTRRHQWSQCTILSTGTRMAGRKSVPLV